MVGFGITGFMSRCVVEITYWFGSAQEAPRPQSGFIYPVTEHGRTFYVSAAEAWLHDAIFFFWLIFVIGLLLSPREKDLRRPNRKRIYDPDGLRTRWEWIGAGAVIAVMLLVHLLAGLVTPHGVPL